MEKVTCLLLVLLFVLTGCGGNQEDSYSESQNVDKNASAIESYSKENMIVKEVTQSDTTIKQNDSSINLKNDYMDISIDMDTLEITNTDKAGKMVAISDAIEGLKISDVTIKDNQVVFSETTKGIQGKLSLVNNKMLLDFVTDKENAITFPVIKKTTGFDSYILPQKEGKYIPKDDKGCIEFLTQQESWDTVEFFSMPFFSLYNERNTYTYVIKTGYNNEVSFTDEDGILGLSMTHHYTIHHKEKIYSYEMTIGESDYIYPAKVFREYLIQTDQFVTLEEKAKKTPDLEKLYGAVQIYLWSSGVLDKKDIGKWGGFAKEIYNGRNNKDINGRIWTLLDNDTRGQIEEGAKEGFVINYSKKAIIRSINSILKNKKIAGKQTVLVQKFLDKSFEYDANDEAATLISKGIENLNEEETYRLNLNVFYENYKKYMAVNIEDVGNAYSTKMLNDLESYGIDKAWLCGDNMARNWMYNSHIAEKAIEKGYLISAYDSYHSMHDPEAVRWETAGFDKELWDNGGVMRKNGKYFRGFLGAGKKVSPLVALPYVKDRMKIVADNITLNSWFIDCDAAGELFEDYNPLHPASMEDDRNARAERIQYIIDEYNMVVGSEGGCWYLSDVIHFAQGIMTPVINWVDEDLRKNEDSEYFLGKYWPVENPAAFTKQVPMKDQYIHIYTDPRYRIPLYEIVYHDSIVISSHWQSGSLKFSNTVKTQALTEMLYGTMPLYNLNLEELEKHGDFINKFYSVFSPLHRKIATMPLTKFEILTDDRWVQKSTFGDSVEVVVNYKSETFVYNEKEIPVESAMVFYKDTGLSDVFTVE